MVRPLIATLVLLAVVLAAPVRAQETPEPSPDNRDEALQRIEMLRLFRLTEVLELNEDEAARVFPVIRRYDRSYQDLQEKREQFMHELQLQLASGAPDRAALSRLVDEVLTQEREAMRVRNEEFKELKKILTPEQYAKYLIFDARFREDLNRLLDDIRRHRQQRRHPGAASPTPVSPTPTPPPQAAPAD